MWQTAPKRILKLLGAYLAFELVMLASEMVYPIGEVGGTSLIGRCELFVHQALNPLSYLNPLCVFFFYVVFLKWVLVDRKVRVTYSVALIYYAFFGGYYGILFVNNLNGELHWMFDQRLGMKPNPLASAIFPLSLALVLPIAITWAFKLSTSPLRRNNERRA